MCVCGDHVHCTLLVVVIMAASCSCNWNEWWTYDGISGPTYWGVINPAWSLCSKGRYQSPIDVQPRSLVFDRTMSPVTVDKRVVSGVLSNTGQSLSFRVDDSYAAAGAVRGGGRAGPDDMIVNITGGPLAYRYQFESLYLHWGPAESSEGGSEHSVAGHRFPAEVQLMGFNAQLFSNLSQALGRPHGVVGVAVMVQEDDRRVNPAIRTISQLLRKVTYRGQHYQLPSLTVSELMPSTDGFMTYEGSSTQPGCEEGVTWIIMNRPVYASRLELTALRALKQGEKMQPVGSPNSRPAQDVGGRTVRTNLAPSNAEDHGSESRRSKGGRKKCPDLARQVAYKPNHDWREDGDEGGGGPL